MPLSDRFVGRCSALAIAALLLLTFMPNVAIAATLFPEPLHLTRVVDDPISGQAITIEEYYLGNRVVSITGDRTVIADYARNEVTEIDRGQSTYSVTSFLEVAKTTPKVAGPKAAAMASGGERWSVGTLARTSGRPNTEFFAATPAERSEIRRLEVGVDHSVRLSRDALDVVLGAAYPNERTEQTDVLVRTARGNGVPRLQSQSAGAVGADSYSLPVEQTITYEVDGRELVSRNRVTHVGKEMPLPALLTIPPGARQVELRRAQTQKELEDLERPVTTSTPPNR